MDIEDQGYKVKKIQQKLDGIQQLIVLFQGVLKDLNTGICDGNQLSNFNVAFNNLLLENKTLAVHRNQKFFVGFSTAHIFKNKIHGFIRSHIS